VKGEKEIGKVDAFGELCRRHGIKATHQRTEIYRELVRTNKHPDAETICGRVRRRIPEISLDTVYRALRLFEEMGIISRVGHCDDKTRFDANTDPHHHFICTRCRVIKDFCAENLNTLPIPPEVGKMGKIGCVRVVVLGICKDCQAKRAAAERIHPSSCFRVSPRRGNLGERS